MKVMRSQIGPWTLSAFALVALLGSAVWAQPATFLVASDTFAYQSGPLGGRDGGTGWLGAWWAGSDGTAVDVVPNGFDFVGQKIKTDGMGAQGAFRAIHTTPWAGMTDAGKFGLDGTSMWISFRARRFRNSQDLYGGVSLWENGVGERVFLGCPYLLNRWGVEAYGSNGGISIVANGSVQSVGRIVVRIDFMAGDERLRLWFNNSETYPCTGAAVDRTISDFRFDMIRIKSGGGVNFGGYEFDDLKVELMDPQFLGTPLYFPSLTGGVQALTMDVGPAFAGLPYRIFGSASGSCPGITYSGQVIALNPDPYFQHTLLYPNQSPLANSEGILDAQGRASATVTVPPAYAILSVPLELWHAGVVLSASGQLLHTTHAASIIVTP